MKKTTLPLISLFTLLLFIAIPFSGLAQSPKTYSASGTFTVPAGVTTVGVEAWGAGGGGGSRSGSNGRGGGGGGGAFAANPTTPVSALSGAYSITVGTGGGANTSGGNSSFATLVIADGGNGGTNNSTAAGTGGTAGASTGTITRDGGNGAAGGALSSGAGGGGAGSGGNGLSALLAVGGAGGAGGGGNGAAGVSGNTNGLNGNTFGGGGSGAVRTSGTRNGGSGANGQVILTWTCPTYSLTSTAIASPLCTGNGATVTLTGGTGLPTGNYTVTYSLTGANTATNATATMSVTSAGTGSFTTSTLNNIGLTNIQITNLSSGVSPDNCSNAITVNNTANVTLTAVPAQPSAITGSTSFCGGTSQSYSVTNVLGTTYTWSFPAGWSQTAGGTTNSITVTTNGNSGTVSVTPSNSCGNGTAQTLGVTSNSPTAAAGSALTTICSGATTVALGGSFGGGATSAVWSDGGVGGTFTNNTGSTPNTTTWTAPVAYTGTATLTLTTAGGSCGTTTASKTQVVTTGVFATVASSAITVNGSLTSPALGGSPASGTWTKISGPSGTVTFSNASNGSSTATVPTIGTYVFRWTVNNSCGTTSADISVTYLDANYHRDYTLFYEDFDATDGGWTNTTNTNGSWTRTDTFTGVAEIGENSFWRTNNFNDYANNAVIEITSPVYNFTGYENMLFNIDVRYDTETNVDGMRILYSINNGAFVQLGASGSGINWYNSTSVSALGSNGWSDNNATAALAFTPVGVGPNRFIRATTLLADGTFRNQSNVRFKVEFRSNGSTTDNGVAFDNVGVEGDAIVALADSPIAPANINQNLRLWFKSNAGIAATDGSPLTAWEDQAYDTSRADLINKENVKALTTDAPTYRDNAARNLNFNPVVDFNAANKDYMNGKGGLYSQDYFVVVYPDDVTQNTMGTNGRQIPLGGKSDEQSFHEDPTGLGLGNTTARYSTPEVIAHNVGAYAPGSGSPTPGVDSYGKSFSSTTVTYNEPLIINVKTNSSGTTTEIYKNGIKIDNLDGRTGDTGTGSLLNFYEYKNLPFYLGTGRSGISGRAFSALNGRLSEVVVYTAPNSALNQQKIQSYLGLKYGITLHATNSSNVSGVSLTTRLNDVNYIDSAGNIIWNTIGNTGYNYDVAGIGRDDDSQLYQKQSKTVNTTDDITIGLNTIAATNNLNPNTCNNRNFLVWGNNQGTLAAQAPVIVDMSTGITPTLTTNVEFVSVGRTWKVVEVGGNVPTARVSIPSIMLTATITPPGDFLMFISDTPVFNPTAEYRVMSVNGSNLETSYDFDGTKYITFGYAPERTFERCIKFNGTSDYLDAGKVLDLTPAFTVSAWVNRTTANRTIFSKRNSTFTEGYDLSINAAGRAEMSWFVGASKKTITSSAVIPVGIWHHIGVSFDGTTAKIYIDGINAVSTNLAGTPTAATNQSFLIAAADGVAPTSYFNGSIDEVRVWNVALNDAQFRYVMNQEILRNGTATNGAIVPNTITLNEISSIPWANLMAYYPMSTYTYTNAKDISNNNYTAALRNVVTVDRQTAPLPYISAANAPWESAGTWTNSTLQYIPNSNSIENGTKINWNIVRSTHNISSTTDKTVLGLFVNSGTISATNNTKIEVSHYLKLDGKIDLVGMSQLVQTQGSDLDVTSAGSIERDQQGQASKYNYNYWSSPVSPINGTANNTNYTVTGVMKDGFNTTPRNITWNTTYDGVAGNAGTPVSLARYWLYTFDNLPDSYANWQSISESFSLRVGQGYTLKGAGTATNFTFVGKPNNGTITGNSVSANQLLLVGNPYPSAIDGYQFINDNANINKGNGNGVATDGTLYFWEHAPSNNSHTLWEYAGGYGVLNLTGGLPPVAPAGINGVGTSSKTPKQYIPVGQGFFVYGNGTGGAVNFNNGQRAFVKETDATSTTLFRTKGTSKIPQVINSNTTVAYKKIRLGYNNKDNYHRQVLIGFMDDKATNGFDNGYDGEIMDDFPNDMYFLNSGKQLVIQGEGYFNTNMTYPIGVKTNTEGKVNFTIDEIENFDPQQPVFIHDNLTDTYHDIRTQNYEVTLPAGTNNSRFSLRFIDKTLNVTQNTVNDIRVSHIQNGNIVEIKNDLQDITVEKLTLFNLLGQEMNSWKLDNLDQQNIQVPLTNVSAGVYIIKVKTAKGESSKKIIVN
ncbi:LamG-like jellyroll fold domain-containing protein [Flavobacterium eburneipallidum]|uniref:LamG-like jellyroll fold domain-containing protein n=1 Tax=Flavobacterium eburneipallidum TaxID=3003263 RepID=UPI002482AD2D|nr:LamG-like jellyroll fold domain-containing protein [Flavobacterium eburneipallidum]